MAPRAPARDGLDPDLRRRHALAGARPRPGPDQDRPLVGLRRRRPALGRRAPRRRWSTSTPRTARASTRPPTWPGSRASCRWTATAASSACWRAARRARSGWPSAGRIAEGASTRSTRPPARPWRRRRCAGSASSTRSRRRSAAARPRSGARPGRSAASRSWRPCTPGSPPSWSGSRASSTLAEAIRYALRHWHGAGAVPRGRPARARHQHHRAGDPADRDEAFIVPPFVKCL